MGDSLIKSESLKHPVRAAIYRASAGVNVLGHAGLRMSGLVCGGQRGQPCVKASRPLPFPEIVRRDAPGASAGERAL